MSMFVRALPFFVKRPKLSDKITMVAIEMPSLPVDANPFNHDFELMGTPIHNGLIVMNGTPHKDHHSAVYHYYPKTGQRFQMVHLPVVPEFDETFIAPNEISCFTGLFTFDEANYRTLPPFSVVDWDSRDVKRKVHTPAGAFDSPVYASYKGYAVLLSKVLELTPEEINKLLIENFCDEEEIAVLDLGNSLKKLVDDIRTAAETA